MEKTTVEETPNEVANKIIDNYFEGKSIGFIKATLESIDNVLDIICKIPISVKEM